MVIDDFHLPGVRAAVLDFRHRAKVAAPLLPVPSDHVTTCSPDWGVPDTHLQIFPLTVVYWTRGDERGEHRAAAPAGTPEYQRERAASLNRDKGAGREKSAVSVGVSGDVEPAAP